jgi:hypothetical protein
VFLHALEYRRDALAAADAHGHQRVAALDALQLIQRLDGDQRAGGADGVAQRDARAVGLTLAGPPRPLVTAQAWAAKASLASITSI